MRENSDQNNFQYGDFSGSTYLYTFLVVVILFRFYYGLGNQVMRGIRLEDFLCANVQGKDLVVSSNSLKYIETKSCYI